MFIGLSVSYRNAVQSLLRCRWAEGSSFKIAFLLRVAVSIASALNYLHSLRICHGDVYAHNILPDASGNAVLCDYGERFLQEVHLQA